jgi:hypothetical protein
MKTSAWLAFLFGLGSFAAGCWTNRPLYIAETPDASGPPAGAAGASAGSGPAGTTGGAGTSGGQALPGCDQVDSIIQKYSCGIDGSCHGQMPAAGFSLANVADWGNKLVGVFPQGGGMPATMGQCTSSGIPYLVAGSSPATGLFLDKLKLQVPPCGARMPNIGGPLTQEELDCVQRWADKLTLQYAVGVFATVNGEPHTFPENLQPPFNPVALLAANFDRKESLFIQVTAPDDRLHGTYECSGGRVSFQYRPPNDQSPTAPYVADAEHGACTITYDWTGTFYAGSFTATLTPVDGGPVAFTMSGTFRL